MLVNKDQVYSNKELRNDLFENFCEISNKIKKTDFFIRIHAIIDLLWKI